MASVPQAIKLETRNQKPEKTRHGHPLSVFSLLLVSSFWFLVSTLGCLHLPKTSLDDPIPHGAVCQVVATWNHEVIFAPDPIHGGTPTPGLAGRLYLFGPEISYPLVEEGSLIVDLFDDTKAPASNPPLPLEEWRLDPATLKRLVKKDMIGYGYTLFLPWGTYKPEVNQIHLKVHFVTAKGASYYAESGPLSLDKALPPKTTVTQTSVTPQEATVPKTTSNVTQTAAGPPDNNAAAGPPAAIR
jgi:hypothetical protein